jgi:hypothetical protein
MPLSRRRDRPLTRGVHLTMTTNRRSRLHPRTTRPRIPAQRTTRRRSAPPTPSSTPPAERNWHQHINSAGTTLTAVAAVSALIFTGVSVGQANGELHNRRKELQIAQEGQVTDRFTEAVGQLGNKSLDVKLGGIYALQRIMQDSARDQPAVVNVLSAYVRTHGDKPKVKGEEHPLIAEDVMAATRVLSDRNSKRDQRAVIRWFGAYLALADFMEAHLPGADLRSVDLFGATLYKADLSDANFMSADLSQAVLFEADLSGASLQFATLRSTHFQDANLSRATLDGLDFSDSSLAGANLSHANLSAADLTKADVTDADLTGADLNSADLHTTQGLTARQVASAWPTYSTKLPKAIASDPLVKRRIQQGDARLQP